MDHFSGGRPPDDGNGGSDWNNKVIVALEENVFEVYDANWEPVGVTWLDPDMSLSDPDFLGDNTQSILENWFAVHGDYLQSLGYVGTISIQQSDGNTAVVLIDGEAIATGEIEVQEPNESGEVYWSINFDGIGLGGWNRVTDEEGILSLTENGVQIYIDVFQSEQPEQFAELVGQYTPPESLLGGSPIEDFDFASVTHIAYAIWENDFSGTGYTEVSRVRFLPDDGNGGSDWNNVVEVELESSVFRVYDTDGNPVSVTWLNDAETVPSDYTQFTEHAELLDNLLGTSNVFSEANYSIYGSNLVAVDADKDGTTDVYITNAVHGGDWQEILDPDTLEVIGGLYDPLDFDFARLPSSEEDIALWAHEFFADLDITTVLDEDGIDEAAILNLMSEAIDNIFAPERFDDQQLDTQVRIYKGLHQESGHIFESIGFGVMDEGAPVDIFWVNKEYGDDAIEYSVTISGRNVDGELKVLAETDIYTPAYSDLIATIEI